MATNNTQVVFTKQAFREGLFGDYILQAASLEIHKHSTTTLNYSTIKVLLNE